MFVAAMDLAGLTDGELSDALRETSLAVDRAEAHRLAVAAEHDRRQVWAADGAHNGTCWLSWQGAMSRAEAARVLKTARVVGSAAVLAAAVADGSLPVAKAELLAGVVTERTAKAFQRDQQLLLDHALPLDVDEVRKLARYWARYADEDGPEPMVPEPGVRVTKASDGTVHIKGILGGEDGAVVANVLDGLTDQLWRARRTEQDQDRPPGGCGPGLRAEALVEMARRATAADPSRSGARPLVSVLIDLDTLEGRAGRPATTADGAVISAEAARRLACDADLSRVLLGPEGSVLEVGRLSRTATTDQWRFLRLRDGGCTWPGCDRPAGWCQAHHIIWWEQGGLTDVENLTLLCSFHHHRVHDHGWTIERLDDGSLTFGGPDGRTLHRPPPTVWPLRPPPPRIDPIDRAAIRRRVRDLVKDPPAA